MFPLSTTSAIGDGPAEPLAYTDVTLYGDADNEDVLYEGPVLIHGNGWLEVEGGRLLSPAAVHHLDIYDDDPPWGRVEGPEKPRESRETPNHGERGHDNRTNRFRP